MTALFFVEINLGISSMRILINRAWEVSCPGIGFFCM